MRKLDTRRHEIRCPTIDGKFMGRGRNIVELTTGCSEEASKGSLSASGRVPTWLGVDGSLGSLRRIGQEDEDEQELRAFTARAEYSLAQS
jgi:hypothetical protein